MVVRYGPIKTDHILFIAAGAFHRMAPSDLLPEVGTYEGASHLGASP